jgi:2-C-methyl-D-erythritol 4-phosphate cytidylyltransferase
MGAGTDKAFLSLVSKPVLAWSLLAFERCPEVDRIVLVVRKDQQVAAKAVARMFGISKLHAVVPGGNRRQDSVMAGLDACDLDTRYVMVHDAARPCITSDVIGEVAKLVRRVPAVSVGRRMTDTVKRVDKGTTVACTENRDALWTVQTPQAFQIKTLRDAYKALGRNEVTDDCQAVEMAGGQVRIYETNIPNLKITTVEDLQIAGALLK